MCNCGQHWRRRWWLNPQYIALREKAEHNGRLHKGVFGSVKLNPGFRQGLIGFKWLKIPRSTQVLLGRPLNHTCVSPLLLSKLTVSCISWCFPLNFCEIWTLNSPWILRMLENQSACKWGYLSEVTPTQSIF